MCGLAGIWNYRTGRPVDRDRLEVITQILAHRGPDGVGYYWGPGPGLGHRRLSIIDLEGGRQPMCNEDGSVWIVFNGEIYNFPELRTELERRGHVFRTRSDTEAIVHLYEDYAEGCFEKLRGMFAIAIWDQRTQRLVLARDRLGIKPLFYGLGREGIVFGSELKCVRESGLVDLPVDPTAIADLFTYYYIPGPKTVYKNAYQLEPGHCLVVTSEGIRNRAYWDLREEPLRLPTEVAYQEQLHTLLQETVRCHLLSDVPLGAFLSGGVDSSVVVALMSSLVAEPVMTCSIGFHEEKYNELPRARFVAGRFATDHHEQVLTPEPAKVLEQLTGFYDQPFPDHSSIPTYYVSQLARKRVKVVLSGDGGDENFAGYGRYPYHLWLERIRRWTPGILLRSFAHWNDRRWEGSFLARSQRALQRLALASREAYLNAMTFTDPDLRARIFSPDLQSQLDGYDPLEVFRRIYDRAPVRDPLSKIFYLDIKTYLVDDILTKVDRASMANSLEVRVPLLDHKVVEFAFSLPLHLKLHKGKGKYLLRKTMTRYLPRTHLRLQKKGFTIPMGAWMHGELREWIAEVLLTRSDATRFLNLAGVQEIWNEFQKGAAHWANLLSILFSFVLSARVWAKTPLHSRSETISVTARSD